MTTTTNDDDEDNDDINDDADDLAAINKRQFNLRKATNVGWEGSKGVIRKSNECKS